MAHSYGAEIKMCFAIKVRDTFYGEGDIINNFDELKKAAANGVIDLDTTDGAISIKQLGKEFLGYALWDEIYFVLHDFLGSLDDLCNGQTVQAFMSMQSATITLTRHGETLHYELESTKQGIHIQHDFYFTEFIEELLLLIWRMVRTFLELGASFFAEHLSHWREVSTPELENLIDYNKIKHIIEAPIEIVLQSHECH